MQILQWYYDRTKRHGANHTHGWLCSHNNTGETTILMTGSLNRNTGETVIHTAGSLHTNAGQTTKHMVCS